jgi:hypothetical protein
MAVRRLHCPDDPAGFADALAGNRAHALDVAYTKGRLWRSFSLQWQDPAHRFFRSRAGLRFAAPVVIHARAFLRRQFDALPFLGVQWLRGDRQHRLRGGLLRAGRRGGGPGRRAGGGPPLQRRRARAGGRRPPRARVRSGPGRSRAAPCSSSPPPAPSWRPPGRQGRVITRTGRRRRRRRLRHRRNLATDDPWLT